MNLCLEEKPYLEKDEIDFYGRLLELYEEEKWDYKRQNRL